MGQETRDIPAETEQAIRNDFRLNDGQRDVVLSLIAQFGRDNMSHIVAIANLATQQRPARDLAAREAELRQLASDHGLAIEETTNPDEDDSTFRTYTAIGRKGIDALDDGLTLDEVAAFLAGYSHRT